MKITATILVFEQIGQEEYKTMPHHKEFEENEPIYHIDNWIKSIDNTKNISHAYLKNNDN